MKTCSLRSWHYETNARTLRIKQLFYNELSSWWWWWWWWWRLTHGVAVKGSSARVSCVMLVILWAQFGGRHRLRTDHPHLASHETRLHTNTADRHITDIRLGSNHSVNKERFHTFLRLNTSSASNIFKTSSAGFVKETQNTESHRH